MATINKTFSVKNGIDVANTIIISNTAGTINLSNISIANTTTINSTNFLTSAGLDVVGQANAAFGQANNAYGQANAAYTAANTGINTVAVSANAAGTLTSKQLNFNNSASILVSVVASSDGTNANVSFTTSGASAGAAYDQANAAYTQANAAYGGANTANTNALNAYGQANTANTNAATANTNALNAYAQANTSGNTVWIYANGTSVLSKSNINFNNTATVNVSATANGTTQSNIAFSVNVSSTDWASGANSSAQTTFGTINTTFGTTNTTFGTVNTNISNAYSQANLAYTAANTAQTSSNTVYGQANNAYGQANLAYTAANSAQTSANTVYGQANAAYGQANLAYTAANASVQNSGGTITGSLNVNTNLVVGNLYVTGSTTNINTVNLIVDSNTILLAANQTTAVLNAYISVERGGAINTSIIWNEQTGQWGYSEPANATFVAFDTIYTLAITGNNTANGAYTRANLAYTAANSAQTSSNTAYGQANLAYTAANSAQTSSNTAYNQANAAYSQANAAYLAANNSLNIFANSGLILANTLNVAFYNTATTNAIITANGTQGVNASFTVNVSSTDWASGANSSAQTTFGTINTTFGTTNTSITNAYGQANAAYGKANTSAVYANGTLVIGNTANINFNNTASINVVATANGTLQSNISFTVNTAAIVSTPGGSNTQLQFNNNSVFGGTSNLSFNINQNVFTVGTNTLVANATGNYVNIATANISTTITSNLQVVALNVTTNTVTTAAITQVVVDTWPSGAGGLATAKYLVQANSNTIYHITEATLVTDGTNAYLSEFGTIQTAQPLGTLSATVTGGAAQLLYTPASTTSTQIKVVRYGVTY